MFCVLFFFFFKQNTAYEMRISDWSSDVCSSDLLPGPRPRTDIRLGSPAAAISVPIRGGAIERRAFEFVELLHAFRPHFTSPARRFRSEQHTSELQSLMRTSYAVCCLKKKTMKQPAITYNYTRHRKFNINVSRIE